MTDYNPEEVINKIKAQISQNPIVLYMKGTPKFPSCGFSSRTVQAVIDTNVNFAYVDILQNPDIRQELPKYAEWPTFPQLWVNGELIGGCDIVCDLHRNNKLKEILEEAVAK